jgi:hypothetical protein
MSNYLLAEMNKNSFVCLSSITILDRTYDDLYMKLDTGCTYSTIPYYKLVVNSNVCRYQKVSDILNNIKSMQSYGVESGGFAHEKLVTYNDKLNCRGLKFRHKATNFSINSYKLPDLDLFVNYDRRGNILIGMDILSKFDIHIGTSNITDKETLLAVLKDQSDKSEYYNALYRHFGIVPDNSLLAENIRTTWKSK